MSTYGGGGRSRRSVSPIPRSFASRPLANSGSYSALSASSGYSHGSSSPFLREPLYGATEKLSPTTPRRQYSSDLLSSSRLSSSPLSSRGATPLFDDLPPHLHSRYTTSHDYLTARTLPRSPSPRRRETTGSISSARRSTSRDRYHTVSTDSPTRSGAYATSNYGLEPRDSLSSFRYSRSPTPSTTSGYASSRRSTSPGLASSDYLSDDYRNKERHDSLTKPQKEYKSLTSRVLSKGSDSMRSSDAFGDLETKSLLLESRFIANDLEKNVDKTANFISEMNDKMLELERRRWRRENKEHDASERDSPVEAEDRVNTPDIHSGYKSNSDDQEHVSESEPTRRRRDFAQDEGLSGDSGSESGLKVSNRDKIESSALKDSSPEMRRRAQIESSPEQRRRDIGSSERTKRAAKSESETPTSYDKKKIEPKEDVAHQAKREPKSSGEIKSALAKFKEDPDAFVNRKESIVEIELCDEDQIVAEVNKIKARVSRLAPDVGSSTTVAGNESSLQSSTSATGETGASNFVKSETPANLITQRVTSTQSASGGRDEQNASKAMDSASSQPQMAFKRNSQSNATDKKDSQSLLPIVVVGIIVIIVAVVMFKKG